MKNEALQLADALDDEFTQGRISNHTGRKSAAELRRSHSKIIDLEESVRILLTVVSERDRLEAQRDALLEALAWIDRRCPAVFLLQDLHKVHMEAAFDAGVCARAAIKQAEGENT